MTEVTSQNDLRVSRSFGQYTNYKISRINIDRMKELKKKFNIKSYDALISFFIHTIDEEKHPTPTFEAIMENNVPVILTGIPGVGKTTFLRDILVPRLEPPVFVLDPHNEYPSLKEITLGDFFALDFANECRKLRLVTHSNIDVSKSQGDIIFRHLIMFQKSLKRWTLIVEEGHRFQESPFLKSFMAEARKHTRKVVVIGQQVESFKGLGLIYEVPRSANSHETIALVSNANSCST
jgi:hypothetical protein